MAYPQTIRDRLNLARQQRFVGREHEIELFRELMAAAECSTAVLFVHGLGGVGKSPLSAHVAKDGVLLFLEIDIEGVVIESEMPLAIEWIDRMIATFRRPGLDARPGLRMRDQFVAAGLDVPRMQ